MSTNSRAQLTLALPPEMVAGRSVNQLQSSPDIVDLLVRSILQAAQTGGYRPAGAEVDFFADPDEYATADEVHTCPACTALRDQRIASMRDQTLPVVIVVTIVGVDQ